MSVGGANASGDLQGRVRSTCIFTGTNTNHVMRSASYSNTNGSESDQLTTSGNSRAEKNRPFLVNNEHQHQLACANPSLSIITDKDFPKNISPPPIHLAFVWEAPWSNVRINKKLEPKHCHRSEMSGRRNGAEDCSWNCNWKVVGKTSTKKLGVGKKNWVQARTWTKEVRSSTPAPKKSWARKISSDRNWNWHWNRDWKRCWKRSSKQKEKIKEKRWESIKRVSRVWRSW